MLILFDHGTPRGLIRLIPGHDIAPATAMGWEKLSNGNLLKAAEEGRFASMIKTDQCIRYQQNLAGRKIPIVVLTGTTKWTQVRLYATAIGDAVAACFPGSYLEVFIPFAKSKYGIC